MIRSSQHFFLSRALGRPTARRNHTWKWRRAYRLSGAFSLLFVLGAAGGWAQQQQAPSVPRPKPPLLKTAPPVRANDAAAEDAPLPGDWAPELLDGILSASNPGAAESLYDAAFAVGPGLIPQLQAGLKDDRTAEFAAQSLAFIGGDRSIKILQTLISDPRDLDLRRFYLGALGEFPSPSVDDLLLRAVAQSDLEPDRTVTDAAIWALTVRSDASLAARLRQSEPHIQDIVIREAADNAADAIDARVKYLASPEGRNAGFSIEEAVRAYFIGALENPPGPPSPSPRSARAEPSAHAEVNRLVFSPDGTRALAHVTFSDPDGAANYDMVVQKEYGDWKVVSVWMGSSTVAPEQKPPAKSPHRLKPPVRSKPAK
jgi:hypothetical protein